MPSKLLVTSNSNINLIKDFDLFSGCEIMMVDSPPNKTNFRRFSGDVFALGGGSVIDTAKIVSGDKPCYAIPTNASGACSTSHACVWTKKEKIDVKTPIPILIDLYKYMDIKLDEVNQYRTITDLCCHLLESYNSIKCTEESSSYVMMARQRLLNFQYDNDIASLIEAGVYGGKAIEITGTNFMHAMSYILTLEHGLCHGDALRAVLDKDDRFDWQDITMKSTRYKKSQEVTSQWKKLDLGIAL